MRERTPEQGKKGRRRGKRGRPGSTKSWNKKVLGQASTPTIRSLTWTLVKSSPRGSIRKENKTGGRAVSSGANRGKKKGKLASPLQAPVPNAKTHRKMGGRAGTRENPKDGTSVETESDVARGYNSKVKGEGGGRKSGNANLHRHAKSSYYSASGGQVTG